MDSSIIISSLKYKDSTMNKQMIITLAAGFILGCLVLFPQNKIKEQKISALTVELSHYKDSVHYLVDTAIVFKQKMITQQKNRILTQVAVKDSLKRELQTIQETINIKKSSKNHRKLIGKFIMEDAQCAGLTFTHGSTALWTNELFCEYPDSLHLTWIDSNTFYTKETKRRKNSGAPGVDIYRIEKFDGNELILKEFNSSWLHGDPQFTRYYRK